MASEKQGARELWLVGASRGIGAGLAGALGRDFVLREISRTAGHEIGDAEVVRGLLDAWGAPRAWVHTPGAFFEKSLLATSDQEWGALFESNLFSFVRAARSILPAMAASGGGRVVVFGVAGLSATTAKTFGPAYFAAKAALLESMRSLARVYAPDGISINMVSPGAIAHEHSHRESQERVRSQIPRGRLGEPRDLAGLVRFLVSDEADYVTGQEICVDGGLSLGNKAPL